MIWSLKEQEGDGGVRGGDVRAYLADKICEWSLKGHLGNGYQHMEYASLE